MKNIPPNKHPDHETYILAIRRGEKKIWETIYRKERPPNVKWVINNGGTEQDGKDIFQRAVLIINDKAFDKNFMLACALSLYLHGICRNLWLKELKKRGRETDMVRNLEKEEPMIEDHLEKHIEEVFKEEKWVALKERTFLQISELCQKVLTLYREDADAEEIGKELNMKKNAVYKRKNACKLSWRKAMESDPDFKNCNPFNL